MGAPQRVSEPTHRIDTTAQRRDGTSVRRLPDAVLAEGVRAAAGVWEDLVDQLTAGGMLPSVEVADRVVSFLDGHIRWAGEAHAELLRRSILTEATREPSPVESRRGLDGR